MGQSLRLLFIEWLVLRLVFRHLSTINEAVIDWESKLQDLCQKIGASHAGLTPLDRPFTWQHYENWLEQGFAGEMEYLKTHAPVKKDPLLWKPTLHSAIVVAFPYVDHPEPHDVFTSTRTALYARGFDYHFWIKSKLQNFIQELQALYPDEKFETHTDSSPLLERDLAKRAGLGWFGKNTCLIHPKKGSLFLIGEILTSLKFELKMEALPDFCGKCQKCMEICPTQAIATPRVLDAAKCISYLTIESKKIPPENLRFSIGDWFFGCDLCQTVCPWNQKVFKNRIHANPLPANALSAEQINTSEVFTNPVSTNKLSLLSQLELAEAEAQNLETELRWILNSSHNQILKKVKGTPLYRAGAKGLKRNALIVIANRKMTQLHEDVQRLASDDYLGELATWTLAELAKPTRPAPKT